MGFVGQVVMVSAISGLSTGAVMYGYGKSARKSKGAGKPAAVAGLISAALTAGAAVLGFYLAGGATTSGLGLLDVRRNMGLLNVQRSVGRMGAYIPEPTVKKFSSFTGTRYFS